MLKQKKTIHLNDFHPPEHSSILLDTDVIIDSFKYSDEFDELWKLIRERDCVTLTLSTNEIEFLSGSKSLKALKTKRSFLKQIVDSIIQVDKKTQELCIAIISIYGKDITPGTPDLYLAASSLKYQGNLRFLTSNARHFPSNIFKRSNFFQLETTANLKTYALYELDDKGFVEALDTLIKGEEGSVAQ